MSIVEYQVVGPAARITMNRPGVANAQNVAMTEALSDAFGRAMADDAVSVVLLYGAGKHWSGGHDVGTPERDMERRAPHRSTDWWDHRGRGAVEAPFVREDEVYLERCLRFRALPKPTVAVVQGACIAGGFMLAMAMDLIVASDDAFFSDPVVKMGIPGVEYFAHPFALPPRVAKEMLFTGGRLSAQRAHSLGFVSDVVPRDQLDDAAMSLAERIATQPAFGLALAKRAVNLAEDRMGLRDAIQSAYGLHHLAHAHNVVERGHLLGGHDGRSMAKLNKSA